MMKKLFLWSYFFYIHEFINKKSVYKKINIKTISLIL